MPLFRYRGPARKKSPAGTTTRPPPALAHSSMAFLKPPRASVRPSPLAPCLVTSQSRSGKVGATMRARIAWIAGCWSQGGGSAGGAGAGTAGVTGVSCARDGSTTWLPVAQAPSRTASDR